jgi:hypothetical protein
VIVLLLILYFSFSISVLCFQNRNKLTVAYINILVTEIGQRFFFLLNDWPYVLISEFMLKMDELCKLGRKFKEGFSMFSMKLCSLSHVKNW